MNVQVHTNTEIGAPGLVNFTSAVAYHFCPSLNAEFMKSEASTLANLCTEWGCKSVARF